MMDKTVTLKVKDLVLMALVVVLLFTICLQIVQIRKELQAAKLIFQVQNNSQNIQALDRALADLAKKIEELSKGK